MSTPSPRTDAVYLEHRHWANEDEATEAIEDFRDFARTLEHELNESRNAERLARVQLGAEREKVRVLREACIEVERYAIEGSDNETLLRAALAATKDKP